MSKTNDTNVLLAYEWKSEGIDTHVESREYGLNQVTPKSVSKRCSDENKAAARCVSAEIFLISFDRPTLPFDHGFRVCSLHSASIRMAF